MTAEQIKRYGNLPMVIESEVGRCLLSVGDVLRLTTGSVVKLSAPAGSDVQVLVGGAPFGAGEVVRNGKARGVRLLRFENKKG